MTFSHANQRAYHRLHTELREHVSRLAAEPFVESMAAFLASGDIDLNHADAVLLGLINGGFSAKEINYTVDRALPRAFEMRRDAAVEIGAFPRADERLSVEVDSSGLNDRQAFPILKGAAA